MEVAGNQLGEIPFHAVLRIKGTLFIQGLCFLAPRHCVSGSASVFLISKHYASRHGGCENQDVFA